MPVGAVGRLVGEHDTRLWRVLHHYVDEARARADYSGVTRVAFDETAARRGHDYVSLFVDLDGPRVLFVADGKDAATVEKFARLSEIPCKGGCHQAKLKRPSNRMASWALAMLHSRGGIFHSFAARFNTRKRSFRALSSVGKWPLVLTARRSLAFKLSMAFVV